MRMSQLFSKTLREAPAGADSKGMNIYCAPVSSGNSGRASFPFSPGLQLRQKIEQIIREEMDAIGAGDPHAGGQPRRYLERNGPVLFNRPGNEPLQGPGRTGHGACDDPRRGRHRHRPLRDRQLQADAPARLPDPDEMAGRSQALRRSDPGSGVHDEGLLLLRYRPSGTGQAYAAHYLAYFKIFGRTGLPTIVVGADSGMMGGKISHEYMYPRRSARIRSSPATLLLHRQPSGGDLQERTLPKR